jgi:hypothetical protein
VGWSEDAPKMLNLLSVSIKNGQINSKNDVGLNIYSARIKFMVEKSNRIKCHVLAKMAQVKDLQS